MFPVQSSLARTTAKTREKDEADMASTPRQDPDPDRIGEVMSNVRLPLENVEFVLEQYLLANGQRLDADPCRAGRFPDPGRGHRGPSGGRLRRRR